MLLSLVCPLIIVYDENGDKNGPSFRFVENMQKIISVTGKNKFGGLKWVHYLESGFHGFFSLFPMGCTELTAQQRPLSSLGGYAMREVSEWENKNNDSVLKVLKEMATIDEEDNRFQRPSNILKDFLYLGGLQATSKENILKEGIKLVLSIGETPLFSEHDTAKRELMETGTHENIRYSCFHVNFRSSNEIIIYYHYEIEDSNEAPIKSVWTHTTPLLTKAEQEKTKTLVHCFGGVSRSPSVIIAYLMERERNLSLAEAFASVFSNRPYISPNDGFWKALQVFETEISIKELKKQVKEISRNSAVTVPLIKTIGERHRKSSALIRIEQEAYIEGGSLGEKAMKNIRYCKNLTPELIESKTGISLENCVPIIFDNKLILVQ